jgi:hypothetical protein
MPLKYFKNKLTGEEKQSLKEQDPTQWEEILQAPNQKFMIASNPERGVSKIKDQEKMLKERARNYSRNVDIDDNIQINRLNGLDAQVSKNLLNSKGQRRRKIDDI